MLKSFVVILFLSGLVFAQAGAPSQADTFRSVEGRFSISLPKDTAEFEEIKPTTEEPRQSGGKYIWSMPEGVVTVDYTDDPDSVIKSRAEFAGLEEGMLGGVGVFGGKALVKKRFYLDGFRGYQISFIDKDKMKGSTRMLIVGERKYILFGLARNGVKGSNAFITKTLDSFRLIKGK